MDTAPLCLYALCDFACEFSALTPRAGKWNGDVVCFSGQAPVSMSPAVFDEQFAACRSLLEKRARQRLTREDAEDMVSACYVQARSLLACYDAGRSLLSWLLGILDNLLRQRSRLRWVQSEQPYDAETGVEDVPDEQTARGARQEAQHLAVRDRLRRVDLTARQYECVVRVLAGQTQQHIADVMHISQRMVSYHLRAASLRLRHENSAGPDAAPDHGNSLHAMPGDGGLDGGAANGQDHAAHHGDCHEEQAAQEEHKGRKGHEPGGRNDADENGDDANAPHGLGADWHAEDFFCECARHVIYRKPHSFDNQSDSQERERRRYQCLREDASCR